MKVQDLIIVFLAVLASVYLASCAQVAVPTGGDKDTIPPLVIHTIPANKSTNYKGQEIYLEFNEIIQLNNLTQELLITPSIQSKFDYEPRKNRLKLTFDQPFDLNTTYTFNFRKALKDVTEGNIAENMKLVFSTGPHLDSLNVRGKVLDLLTGKPVENTSVTLYRANDTLTIFRHAPVYVTKTDKEGNYALENLKAGEYTIYALQESNNNLKYDQPKEKVAYLNSPIQIDSSIAELSLMLSSIDTLPPKIVRRKPESNYVDIEFDEGLTVFTLIDEGSKDWVYQLKEPKIARIYNTVNIQDSISIRIVAEDSLKNALESDIKIKFDEIKRGKAPATAAFEVKTNPADREKILNDFTYTIAFNKPVVRYDLTGIQFLADTIHPIPMDVDKNYKWNPYFTELTISKQHPFNERLKVEIPAATFFSVDGDTSKAITIINEIKKPSNYGRILGNLKISSDQFIIQLLNASYEVVAEQKNKKAFSFSFLPAGTYYIRVITDLNGNGKWDQGNIFQNRLPEPVHIHPKEIKLKENWEMEEQVII